VTGSGAPRYADRSRIPEDCGTFGVPISYPHAFA
jgi:hypothetical protein